MERKPKLLHMPPAPQQERAKMPDYLSAEAKEFWRRHEDHLAREGNLIPAFQSSFALLCSLWAEYLAMTAEIHRDGMTTRTATGRKYPHPLLAARNQILRLYLKCARDFGLSPKSRRRTE